MKDIILIGHYASSGAFVPCFFFENQSDFESWFNENKILENNFSLYKFKVSSFSSFNPKFKDMYLEFIKNPSI